MTISVAQSKTKPAEKSKQVEALIRLAEESSVIALTDLTGISSKALQGIRTSLRKGRDIEATIKVAKNTLKTLALEDLSKKTGKKDFVKLFPFIKGSCGFIFSNANPFRLQKFLNQNQVPAPAKAGQVSPVEVTVPEGTTNLDPGPIISELGSIGLQTRIEKGKIRIAKTATVLSPGDVVTEAHASVLTRLGIQPFKIGLKLNIVLEDGELIDGSILDIDESQILSDLQTAYLQALSLASNPQVSYYTEETIPFLLKTAIAQSIALAYEIEFITENTVNGLLSKASQQALLLKKEVAKKKPDMQF